MKTIITIMWQILELFFHEKLKYAEENEPGLPPEMKNGKPTFRTKGQNYSSILEG